MLELYRKNEMSTHNQERLNDSAKEILKNLYSRNTHKAYKHDLEDFHKYLDHINKTVDEITPSIIINYLNCLREGNFDHNPKMKDTKPRKYATLQRRLISIRFLCRKYGEQRIAEEQEKGNSDFVYHNPSSSDQIRDWMKALKNTIGVKQKSKRAATKRIMNALLNEIQGNRLIDIRNRALLAIGYAGAFRRSEIAALKVEDLEYDSDGIYITLSRSKTDQEGKGHRKYIYYGEQARYCPVRLLDEWLRASRITEGALFRSVTKGGKIGKKISDTAIYYLIRDVAEKAGFDKTEFGGHSLRRGLVTQLADDGVEERNIMRHTGHTSPITVRRYIEEVDEKKKSPTKGIL